MSFWAVTEMSLSFVIIIPDYRKCFDKFSAIERGLYQSMENSKQEDMTIWKY